jgi:hypothetical protein
MQSESAKQRAWTIPLWATVVVWMATYFVARGLLETVPETARWYRVAAAVLPVPFFILFLWKFISSVRLMDELERRIHDIARLQAESFGAIATVDYQRSYDATINHKAETDFLRARATAFAGPENVTDLERPFMGSEDFAYMLKACPGSYFFLGTARGKDDKPLHHPAYDFNDDVLPIGTAFWVDVVENFLPLRAETAAE